MGDSDSEALKAYKSYVNNKLVEITTHFKTKTDLLKGVSFKDDTFVNNLVSTLYTSSEVRQFIIHTEALEKTLQPHDRDLALQYKKDKSRQILNKDIDAYLKKKIFAEILREIKQNPPRPLSESRSYDQVVKGDIKISEVKNNNNYSHKIKFNEIGKFLLYQVWDPTGIVKNTYLPRDPSNDNHPKEFHEAKAYVKENPDKVVVVDYPINNDRDVKLLTAKEWVLFFNSVINYSPTTVMKIDYKYHVFVIKKAEINKNDKVVFYISTKEIQVNNNNNKSEQMKNLKKIPLGKHKNVRFDIDYGNSITGDACNGGNSIDSVGTSTCYCPAGSYITTMAAAWIGLCMSDCDAGWWNTGGVCYDGCGDCDAVGPCCWDGWSACGCKSSYIPSSFVWGSSDGYLCNSDGFLYQASTSICGQGPTCWNAGDNSQLCCVPEGESSCCPPGSSC